LKAIDRSCVAVSPTKATLTDGKADKLVFFTRDFNSLKDFIYSLQNLFCLVN
jgi:hypothetical protein